MRKNLNPTLLFISMIFVNILLFSCNEKEIDPVPEPLPLEDSILRAADLSFLPEIEEAGITFYNRADLPESMPLTLKNAGLNTVRIRLWHTPEMPHSGFAEVKVFAERLKAMGLKVWLTVHYSDTWADPGHQYTPAAWQSLDILALKDSVYNYTSKIIQEIQPDYIQIGNEINPGFLWPLGNVSNLDNFVSLLQSGSKAVRDNSNTCKIMLHYAGFDGSSYFFSKLQAVDYDMIALSYYPIWHGKDLNQLQLTLNNLVLQFHKKVIIAETSYPFTFGWNDWTNNVIGGEDQILPQFPATSDGQKSFLNEIKRISTSAPMLAGFAYWGGEWVSFKGPEATNGSSWENQAFYDFDNRALPVIEAFGK